MPNVTDVVQEIRVLAEESPEALRESKYVMEGQPHCIVGVALNRLGFDIEKLDAISSNHASMAMVILEIEGAKLKDKESLWITDVQSRQDEGNTWAEAVQGTDEEFGFM